MKTSIKLLEKDEDKSPKVPTLKVYRNPHVNEIDVNSPLHPAWRYTRIEPILNRKGTIISGRGAIFRGLAERWTKGQRMTRVWRTE